MIVAVISQHECVLITHRLCYQPTSLFIHQLVATSEIKDTKKHIRVRKIDILNGQGFTAYIAVLQQN